MTEAPRHSECLLLGSREGTVQRVVDIYGDAGDGSFVAVATATGDAVCAGEGENARVNVLSDSPSECNDLSFNRCGSEGYVAASEGTGQAHGGQLIETIGTVDMQRGAGRRVGLADATGKNKGRLPGTVDNALNCQLPAMSGVAGVAGGCAVVDVGGIIGAGAGTPPHPKRTVAERAKTAAKDFMSFLPKKSWSSCTGRRRIRWTMSPRSSRVHLFG